MDPGLRPRAFAGRAFSARRRVAWTALVIAVVLVHGAVTRELADRMTQLDQAQAMPERIAVAYVRTIEPEAPPPPPRAAAPAPRPPPRRAPRRVAAAASAVAEPAVAEPVVAAASAPAPEPEASAPDAATLASAEPASSASEAATSASAAASAPGEGAISTAVASADPTASAAAASAAAAFEWPASTRVSYILVGNYRGEVSGSAQVEWIRIAERYQTNVDLAIGPEFAPLITRRMTSAGRIAPSGLVPERYDEDTQIVFRDRRRMSVVFEPDAVVLSNGERRDPVAGAQDAASQFVQLTYLFTTRPELLKVGAAVGFPLALPRAIDTYVYDVVEMQTVDAPFGPLVAFHLKPRPRPGRKPGALSIEFWIAPELRYLPVRIRIEQDPATFAELTIAQKPEMGEAQALTTSEPTRKTP
jgi:Protein of unknown function (DUF3108)